MIANLAVMVPERNIALPNDHCTRLRQQFQHGQIDHRLFLTAIECIRNRLQSSDSGNIKQQMVKAADLLEDTLGQALQIALKESAVTFYFLSDGDLQSPDIGIYQVCNNDDIFYILPDVNFCQCDVYKVDVTAGHVYTCQHVVACQLADAVNKTQRVASKAADITEMIMASAEISTDL